MLTDYQVVGWLNTGVVRAKSTYGTELFTLGKLRKPARCAKCDDPLQKGASAFRPITNGYNRMHRVCKDCFTAPAGLESGDPHVR